MKRLFLVIILVVFLVSCGQNKLDKSVTSPPISEFKEFLELAGMPTQNRQVFMIDGDTNVAYEITQAENSNNLHGLSLSSLSVKPAQGIDFETVSESEIKALADPEGPYGKYTFAGATGFDIAIRIPKANNYSGQSHYLYGGYESSKSNVEVGLQHDKAENTQWQLFMRINETGIGNEFAPNTGGTYQTSGWRMTRTFFDPGTDVYLRSESVIGSDGNHYVQTKVGWYLPNYTYATIIIGYKPAAQDAKFTLQDLRPNNINNIRVRRVVAIASPTPGSKMIGAVVNGSALKNGVSAFWSNPSTYEYYEYARKYRVFNSNGYIDITPR